MWRGPCGFSPTPAAASSPARCCMSAAAPASAACCCKRMTAVPHLHASALPRCAPALSAAVPADSPAAGAAGHPTGASHMPPAPLSAPGIATRPPPRGARGPPAAPQPHAAGAAVRAGHCRPPRGPPMTWDVALILLTDGLANGAIYLLAGLGLVLVFSVTRVVFVPFGDIAAFAALTLAAFETGRLPPTIGLVAVLALLATLTESASLLRRGQWRSIPGAALAWGLLPLLPCALAWLAAGPGTPAWLHVALAVLLVLPIAPLLARVVFQPLADASVLVLLIVSLALHLLLSNLGLLFFGPEGSRTRALVDVALTLGAGFTVGGQVLLMLAAAGVLSGLFFLVFERTVAGKALRATAVNRVGARLVGIRPARTARLAYGCASLLAGLIGVLIAPVTTMYYDSGFIIGLKAFVAAIIGGLVSYPMTALGALAVGVLESFASFWSGALKDVIVFSLLIPVLMLRSWMSVHSEEDPEELEP